MILGTFHFMEVFMLIVLVALIGYYIWKAIKYFKKKAQEGKLKRTLQVTIGIVVVIFIGLTLPFHYLPYHGRVLVKANLTFKNTIVTNNDIEGIVKRYNNSNFMQQVQMRQDPFIQTLMESGVLFDIDRKYK